MKRLSNIQLQGLTAGIGLVLLLGKWYAFYITGSVAIYTDALESIVNVLAGILGTYSLYLSGIPRDENHPYGHGKIEFVSSAIEGSMIVLAGALILFESVTHLVAPEPLQALDLGFGIILITAVINYIMGKISANRGKRTSNPVLMTSGSHLLTDTWSTLGIAAGVILVKFTGYTWLDAAISLGFGVVILVTGFRLVRRSFAGIMDERDQDLMQRLIAHLNTNRIPEWVDLHNMRAIRYGSKIHVDAHLTLPWYLDLHEAHKILDKLTILVREKFPDEIEFSIHMDGCMDFSCSLCQVNPCRERKFPFFRKVEWDLQNATRDEKHRV